MKLMGNADDLCVRKVHHLPGFEHGRISGHKVTYVFWEPPKPGLHSRNSAQLCRALVLMQNCHLSPDDHSRVHLTPVEGVPDSDYINASFINVSACPALSDSHP